MKFLNVNLRNLVMYYLCRDFYRSDIFKQEQWEDKVRFVCYKFITKNANVGKLLLSEEKLK